jgi:hypothetical protein
MAPLGGGFAGLGLRAPGVAVPVGSAGLAEPAGATALREAAGLRKALPGATLGSVATACALSAPMAFVAGCRTPGLDWTLVLLADGRTTRVRIGGFATGAERGAAAP